MTNRVLLLAAAACATPTLADGPIQGTATWLWDVTTQDGDAIVEPGETATVTLSVLMEPDRDPFVAFASARIDVVGDDDAHAGQLLDWGILSDLDILAGDPPPYSDGVSIFNALGVQTTAFGPFTLDNPIDFLAFEWAPERYEPRVVDYRTDMVFESDGVPVVYVWEGEDMDSAISVPYPATEAAITFTVVPAPPTLLLFTIFTLPRRRSTPSAPHR